MEKKKKKKETKQECYVLSWTNPRNNIQQNSICTATYLQSQKPSE